MDPDLRKNVEENQERSHTSPKKPGSKAKHWVQRNDTRINRVIRFLEDNLGVPRHPGERNPLQVLVLTILSQNTTDPNALRAYENLLNEFPPESLSASDPSKIPKDDEGEVDQVEIRMSQAADAYPSPNWNLIDRASESEIRNLISVCGLQKSKTATIKRVIEWLQGEEGTYDLKKLLEDKSAEQAASMLSKVKGIGKKTAAVTLMEASKVDVCPVDTHVHRICQRLRLVEETSSRKKTFRDLQQILPEDKGYSLHHNLLTFGRSICTAQNPNCEECFLSKICHYYRNEKNDDSLQLKFKKKKN